MNMQAMMQQARKLQKELEKTTTEIDNTTFKYENDNVLISLKAIGLVLLFVSVLIIVFRVA